MHRKQVWLISIQRAKLWLAKLADYFYTMQLTLTLHTLCPQGVEMGWKTTSWHTMQAKVS